MGKVISLYLSTIALCLTFFMACYILEFLMGFGSGSANTSQSNKIYWLFVLVHLCLHTIGIVRPQKFALVHRLMSTVLLLVIYLLIAVLCGIIF